MANHRLLVFDRTLFGKYSLRQEETRKRLSILYGTLGLCEL